MPCGGLILAGGEGRRMGYQNKGLIAFGAASLIDPLVVLLKQHCDYVAISANQNLAEYQQRQVDVWPDEIKWRGVGPLAGVISSVPYFPQHIDRIQVVPCDAPFLTETILQALSQVLISNEKTTAVYARTPTQSHPVIFQFKRTLLPSLEHYLSQSGKHSIRQWLELNQAEVVDFDSEDLFANINDMVTLTTLSSNFNCQEENHEFNAL